MPGQGTGDRGEGTEGPRELLIPPKIYQGIVDHCQSLYPKEACGILAGPNDPTAGQRRAVVHVYRMTNTEDSPIGYAMDPKEQLKVEKEMRQRGQRMIGIYHSHTASAAYPSSVDVSLAISPDLSYVLVSFKDRARPELKSYAIDGQRVVVEPVQVDAA